MKALFRPSVRNIRSSSTTFFRIAGKLMATPVPPFRIWSSTGESGIRLEVIQIYLENQAFWHNLKDGEGKPSQFRERSLLRQCL